MRVNLSMIRHFAFCLPYDKSNLVIEDNNLNYYRRTLVTVADNSSDTDNSIHEILFQKQRAQLAILKSPLEATEPGASKQYSVSEIRLTFALSKQKN